MPTDIIKDSTRYKTTIETIHIKLTLLKIPFDMAYTFSL